jgi:hypothetical protein
MAEAPGRDDHAARQPDPDVDTWSAWLPDLDRPEPSTSTGAAADAPADRAAGAERTAGATPPHPPRAPQPPLPQASRPLPQASRPFPQASRTFPHASWVPQPASVRAVPGLQPTMAPGPSSHLVLALVSLFVFPIPFGILAVAFAASSLVHRAAGRQARAQAAGRTARNWAVVALAVLPVLSLVATLLFVVVA